MNIVLNQQLAWAASAGIRTDAKGYVDGLEANLWRPMDQRTRMAYQRGSGSELGSKMLALHSSSALVVNFFEHWAINGAAPLAAALDLTQTVDLIEFECQFPTGLPGNPPNLDVCMALNNGHTVAVESKFGEWLVQKPQGKESFKPKYFQKPGGTWSAVQLPRSQALAESVREGKIHFQYLDVPQLLKHALGLATCKGTTFSLIYLYYQREVPQATTHLAELDQFAIAVGEEFQFRAFWIVQDRMKKNSRETLSKR